MQSLAQQVREREPQIERRVAEMDYFVVKKHQTILMNQNVLRAEVAMHQRQLAPAAFLDQAGGLWSTDALVGKVGAAFTSTATQHGGQETTLFSIITNLLHFGMTVVGLDYGFKGQNGVDEVRGGAPYGATTIANSDGSRMPSDAELDGAHYLGRRVAETAAKLAG